MIKEQNRELKKDKKDKKDKKEKDNIHIFSPCHVNELLSIYSANPDAWLTAGGLNFMKTKFENYPDKIIDLGKVEEFKKISRTERHLDIGPMLPISRILSFGHNVIPRILYHALKSIGSPSIRNIVTLGGNICMASPYSDSISALYALEAFLELKNPSSTRWISIHEFIKGKYKSSLEPNEVLTKIRIPLGEWDFYVFKKVAGRQSPCFSTLTFCGLAHIIKGVINDLRLSFGSFNPIVFRSRQMETSFIGSKLPLHDKDINLLISALDDELDPINDTISTKRYRKQTALRLAKNFMKELNQL